ncbi:MAG: hypothetical protein AB8H47_19415 [Bacteroidia bacterium]
MKAYLIIFSLLIPLGVFAISDSGAPTVVSDTLILVPLSQGREIRILEGEYVDLRLSDGSGLAGTIQGVGVDYILVDRQKVSISEISRIKLKPLNSKPKRRGRHVIMGTAAVILAVLGVRAISDGGIGGLFDSPGGSGPLGELVGLIFGIIGVVVLAITALVVIGFLLILLLTGLGISAGKMASKRAGTSYNIDRDYTIKTGLAK